jgi:chemotaxis protein MotA
MLAIIGFAVVTVSVFLFFTRAARCWSCSSRDSDHRRLGGGKLIATTPTSCARSCQSSKHAREPFTRALYLDLLQLCMSARQVKSGLIALEKGLRHRPSPIFRDHVLVGRRHPLRACAGMSTAPCARTTRWSWAHLDTHHDEGSKPAMALLKVGDALPGLGIVAAVLGIVITMQHVAGSPEEIGHHVAVALVGTFLGIFLSYGYVQPLAANMEGQADADSRLLLCIKNCLVAFARGARLSSPSRSRAT